MAVAFNADEILQIAIQIERNGARFYHRAAGIVGDADVKRMLEKLAGMEDSHEQTFQQMRNELSAAQKTPTTFDPEGQSGQYLNALADRRIFDVTADPTEKLRSNETPDQIFRMALDAEKNSIVFYLGMREMVPQKLGKDDVDRIIREEMSHITIITQAFGHRPS